MNKDPRALLIFKISKDILQAGKNIKITSTIWYKNNIK
jgi:hypothetical protein